MSNANSGYGGNVNVDEISAIAKHINAVYSAGIERVDLYSLPLVNPFQYHDPFASMMPTAAASLTRDMSSMQCLRRSYFPGSGNMPYTSIQATGRNHSPSVPGEAEWRGFNNPNVGHDNAADEYVMYQRLRIRSEQEEAFKWNRMYDELAMFYIRFGHCIVPNDNGPLGQWVKKQRYLYSLHVSKGPNVTTLSPQRILKLDALNFEWDGSAARWEEMFIQLQEYAAIHGHCNVHGKKYSEFGLWMKFQRRERRLSSMKKNSLIGNWNQSDSISGRKLITSRVSER